MKEREAVQVLAVAASYDARRASTVEAQTWAYELRDVDQADAISAVREHYRARPDDRIRPGHVQTILADRRRLGLANSSRLEHAALRAIDPDDPAYTERVIDAIQDGRQKAATDPEAIPAHVGLPAREEAPTERAQRARRGAARARAALAEARKDRVADAPTEEGVSESLLKARQIAREMKAARDRQATAGARPLADITDADPKAVVAQFQQLPDREDAR